MLTPAEIRILADDLMLRIEVFKHYDELYNHAKDDDKEILFNKVEQSIQNLKDYKLMLVKIMDLHFDYCEKHQIPLVLDELKLFRQLKEDF